MSPSLTVVRMNIPRSGDGLKVGFGDPGIPMPPESVGGSGAVLELAKGVFVDDTRISSVIKQGRGDPWLDTGVNDGIELLKGGQTSSTSQPPRFTPLIFSLP